MSTSAEASRSCSNVHASNERPSLKDACFTKRSPHNINQPDETNPPLNYPDSCPNCFDDGQTRRRIPLSVSVPIGEQRTRGTLAVSLGLPDRRRLPRAKVSNVKNFPGCVAYVGVNRSHHPHPPPPS